MTNNRKRIERFNHELDAILHNHNPAQDELDEADRQALDLASKFIELDHSSKSLVRQSLRQSLSIQAGISSEGAQVGFSRTSGFSAEKKSSYPIHWVASGMVFLALFLLMVGWVSSGMFRTDASGNSVQAQNLPESLTEYATPTLYHSPPIDRAIAPTPVLLPLAPEDSATLSLATIEQHRTTPGFQTGTPAWDPSLKH